MVDDACIWPMDDSCPYDGARKRALGTWGTQSNSLNRLGEWHKTKPEAEEPTHHPLRFSGDFRDLMALVPLFCSVCSAKLCKRYLV